MRILQTFAFACLLLLMACETTQNTDGNTFVGDNTVGENASEAERLNAEADDLLQQGRTASARELLLKSLELGPTPYTYNSLGVADQLDSNYNSAIAWYQKALAMDSSYVDAKLNMARSYFEGGNPQMGLNLNLDVIAHEPDTFKVGVAHMHIVGIYLSLDNCRAAINHNDAAHQLLERYSISEVQLERNDQFIDAHCNTPEAKMKRWIEENPGKGQIIDLRKH